MPDTMNTPSARLDGRGVAFQLNRMADWVDRRAAAVAFAIAAASALVCGLRAAQMPLWFDEILTILVARLPRVADIWAACGDGADGMPPMFYIAVRAMVRMGWNDALAVRLLCVIGYAVFTFCLFRFVSRQKPAVYGVVAMLLPSLTGCWFFATAGRPYGILLGCTGVAMVCWQSVSRGNRRGPVIVLLALALVAASAVHYLGFLLAFPFAAAETFRAIQRRQADWRVVAAICLPAAILAIYAPLMWDARSHMGIHWGKAQLLPAASDVLETFVFPATPVLAAILIAGFLVTQLSRPVKPDAAHTLPKGEFVLVLAMLSLPAVNLFLGRFATHNFVARYSIEAMAGLAVVLTYSIGTLFLDRREPALLAAFLMVGALAVGQIRHSGAIGAAEHRIPSQALASGLPIAVSHPWTFLAMRYYAGPELWKRLSYVANPEAALRSFGSNSDEYLMIQGARYFGTSVLPYEQLIRQYREFFVFGDDEYHTWLMPQLINDGAEVLLIGPGDRNDRLYRIRMPSAAAGNGPR
jgi:hypothetical protein